jgi:hypothetical protein
MKARRIQQIQYLRTICSVLYNCVKNKLYLLPTKKVFEFILFHTILCPKNLLTK